MHRSRISEGAPSRSGFPKLSPSAVVGKPACPRSMSLGQLYITMQSDAQHPPVPRSSPHNVKSLVTPTLASTSMLDDRERSAWRL